MNTAFVFVVVACILLALFSYFAARRSQRLHQVSEPYSAIRSLDVEAFRNLVDPQEEDFLRANLNAHDFRRIKRERTQAALEYVKVLSEASLQIARFAGAAQRSPDPAIAASGRDMIGSATYLRFRALEARASLMVSLAFPQLGPRPLHSLLEQYDRASQLLQSHGGLQRERSKRSNVVASH